MVKIMVVIMIIIMISKVVVVMIITIIIMRMPYSQNCTSKKTLNNLRINQYVSQ